MSDYTAHNSKVFKVGINDYAERVIKAKLVAMLKSVAQTLVGVIDGSFVMPDGTTQFPVDTANLHDATGVGVYADGVIQHFIPTAMATKAQSNGGVKGILGSPLLQAAISNGATQFSKGIWIVLFSTVPYAYKINTQGSKIGRGAGFFEALKQTLLNDVISGLQPIKA